VKFYAIKPGFTYFGYEIYELEISEGKIKGVYLGKMFNRREKLSILLKSIMYALLGGYFFGTPGYAMAALASPDTGLKIGQPEKDERKNFSYDMNEVKIKISRRRKMLKIKGKRKHEFIVEADVLKRIMNFIPEYI
jgi:hypothetical protein